MRPTGFEPATYCSVDSRSLQAELRAPHHHASRPRACATGYATAHAGAPSPPGRTGPAGRWCRPAETRLRRRQVQAHDHPAQRVLRRRGGVGCIHARESSSARSDGVNVGYRTGVYAIGRAVNRSDRRVQITRSGCRYDLPLSRVTTCRYLTRLPTSLSTKIATKSSEGAACVSPAPHSQQQQPPPWRHSSLQLRHKPLLRTALARR